MLEKYIRDLRAKKEILLMTHIVIGYPSLQESFSLVKAFVEAGVELMELQIPFSEPIADGPVIEHANQSALEAGISVEECLRFGNKVASEFSIPFLFMSYYNIVYRRGVKRFAGEMKKFGLAGSIVPDLPIEEGKEYTAALKDSGLEPIFLFSPTTPAERMKAIAQSASGFIYCVARKGVTGLDTSWNAAFDEYLARARAATTLPIAVGFGVKEKRDVDSLKGKADIAIIGSEMIRVYETEGLKGVRARINSLR
jgi:tryptophan synthase alpha chain